MGPGNATADPRNRLEIGRRTRVVGAFSDSRSCLTLAAAGVRHIARAKWPPKRCLDVTLLQKHTLTA